MIRAVLVDDEPLARDVMRGLLARYSDIVVVAECGNGIEAVAAVRAHDPQLLLLDIQMPDLDGFGVLRALVPHCPPAVVLVTAFDEFAVRAFDADALDFVVKPFTDDRFFRAIDRARRLVATSDAGYRAHFLVASGSRTTIVTVDTIAWIEADDYYARLHVPGGSHLVRRSLRLLESELDPRLFVRVHRSALVSVAHIRELRGRHTVILRDGTRLEISERRRAAVKARLDVTSYR